MDNEIPGYDIEGELGAGAMAAVYLATQRSLDRRVALKVMAPTLAVDEEFCKRFLREGRTLAKLQHPHIVAIYDIGNVGNRYYMAMEYVDGGTLKERIGSGMAPEQALTVLREIAGALGYAHARGLVHRDVKPANILYRADGTAVLSDFGIAKTFDDGTQLTSAGFTVGTPNYMSPEQARGAHLDGRSDLYSLGVMFYELLTGALPYRGTDSFSTALMHLSAPIPTLAPALARFQPLLDRLLAKAPEDRFPDAAALLAFDIDAAWAERQQQEQGGTVALAAVQVSPGAPAGLAAATASASAAGAGTQLAGGATAVATGAPTGTEVYGAEGTRVQDGFDAGSTAAAPAGATGTAVYGPAGDGTQRSAGPATDGTQRSGSGQGSGQGSGHGGGGSKLPLIAAATGAALLAIGGGAWYALQPKPEPKPPVVQTPPAEPKPPVAQTPPVEPKPPVAQTPPVEPKPPVAQTPPPEPKPPVAQTPPEPQPQVAQTPPEPKPPVAQTPPPEPKPPVAQTPVAGPQTPVATGNRPLLIAGKKTLYQRVVLGPGAALFDAPGGRSLHALDPFSIYYVYERRSVGGGTWLRIGGASDGRAEGWLDGSKGYDWRQALTLKFTDRSGRDPVMFFGERAPLENLFVESNARQVVRDWQKKIAAARGNAVPGVPVVALEPAATAVADQRFYLLPIFDYTETFGADGQPLSLLQVATVDPGAAAPPAAAPPAADAFRTGIVFVFDTTRSMNPYLDRARTAIRKIYDRLSSEKLTDKVGIGLVAFRSSVTKTPGLEYVSRVFEPLSPDTPPAQVMQDAQQIVATEVSSHSFNEDAFAGVMDAVGRMDWKPYGARVAILITDAGALRKNDPLGATQMNEAEVRAAALAKGVHLIVLHLRTPAGRNNHASAEVQYRTLAADPNPQIGSLYVPVGGGDVNAFGDAVESIVGKLVDIVRDTAAGKDAPPPDIDAGYTGVADKTAALGYALRMDFLGAKNQTRPPSVVSAWVADRDPARPDVPSLQVCVLLTKLQLNDLQQGLKTIVEAALRAQKSPKDFFQEVASASANFTRGQDTKSPRNLYASGLLGEFLEGLPYKSKVLNLSEDLWLSWSVAEQQDFIQELESKIRLYETYHNDTANWVRFGDADPGDALYRVPLSALP